MNSGTNGRFWLAGVWHHPIRLRTKSLPEYRRFYALRQADL